MLINFLKISHVWVKSLYCFGTSH